MPGHVVMTMAPRRTAAVVPGLRAVWLGAHARAQGGGGQGGGRGAQPGAAPQSRRAAAPLDLTGQWVSLVTDDWRWRMVIPPKGDVLFVPINDAGRKIAESWDPAKDVAAG